MSVALEFLWVPFIACLVLTGIHVYLGLHVLARGVIFVDLALAQVAALGITVAFLAGHPIQSEAAYWYALVFTVGGALLFSASRIRRAPIPQEAVIGIAYAVSAAAAVLAVDRAPQGSEHIKQLLVGSILTVTPSEVGALAVLYAIIGALHWLIRRPLLEISFDPEAAIRQGRWLRWWDFFFYASFGLVVTSSVRIAGVLLVFSYLIVPAAVGALLSQSVTGRLLVGWGFGFLVSVLGLSASYVWDLPTGATVVTTFGALLASVALGLGARALIREVSVRGLRALTGIGVAASALVGLAGLLLLLFPQMDHHWFNWLEEALPVVQLTFLTPRERETYRDSRQAIRRGLDELERLRAMQQEVQWGTRQMPTEMQERLRQFLAGRGEITAGDRMVLKTLRGKAREHQRYWLGLPLLGIGVAGALALARPWRRMGAVLR
ncbi:MAG: metal ABC transporter permease [Candidatus Rokubacteria bacterium]|nr:metal ABC transporter permease [Candidatus Rokubacteria bacterium]